MTKPNAFKRHVYLNLKTLAEARAIFQTRFSSPPGADARETIPTAEALDRITAAPVFARYSSPRFHNAAMDGIAVRADDTYGAHPDHPLTLTLGQQAFPVNTGHLMPPETDAVIMIEQVQTVDDERVRIEAPAYPWQHVRKVGEDIVATEMVVAQGRRLGPYELGALVAAGIMDVPVRKKPRVVIIPTGSELVSHTEAREREPDPGRLIEFNSVILSALVRRAGGEPVVRDIVPDDYALILEALREAVASDADLAIINAGSSAGSEDYTATAMAELGEVLVHGVTIMPGKPTVLGAVGGKPVIGNPGYPVSAIISFEQFGEPLLARILGVPAAERNVVEVTPSQALPSRLGLEEFLRVRLGRIRGRIVAVPLSRGAGSITTLTRAEGVVRIPVDREGIGTEEPARAELLRPINEIEGGIVAIGSHDNTLDILGDLLRRQYPNFSLSSGNVGSLGGLLTLKRGFSHLAGSHLLDVDTGDYNISYIRRHLNGVPVRLLNLVHREQGFIVQPGNPKNITFFKDLTRPDVRCINRQAGSGTRILLDYNLSLSDIHPEDIKGYESEEYTHMAVAAAVMSGRADAGLAIYSSAKALDLDFVPVTTERYDLVIPEEFWEDEKIQALMSIVRSEGFKDAVMNMGGYDVSHTGEIMWTWDGIGQG